MSDSQGVKLVQPEVTEPRLPLELIKTPCKTPKKVNKKINVVEPVQPIDEGPLQPLELTKTPKKINKSAESVQPKVEEVEPIQSEVEPIQSEVEEPLQSKFEEPLQSKFEEPLQSKVAEPLKPLESVQAKVVEPVQPKVVEPVQPKVLEPVQPKVVEPVQPNVAGPLQPLEVTKSPKRIIESAESVQPKVEDAEPIQSKIDEPLQSKVAEPLQPIDLTKTPKKINKRAKPVTPKVVKPVQAKVVELVQSKNPASVQSKVAESPQHEVAEPLQSEVREPVQSEVREPVQSEVRESVQSEVGEPVQSEVGESVQSEVGVPASSIAKPSKPKEITKFSIRRTVWDQMYRSKLVLYPLPFGRIPNFIGTEHASAKLLELDVFQKAKSVQVNPDKSLESARLLVLDNEKDLYVPCPGLNRSLMIKLEPDEEHEIKSIVTRWGIDNLGKRIHMKDEVSIDLMVTGSVAVSESGHRIGKGQGYTDMEFAILKEMKAIDNNTVIVTIVHDSQVMELPKDIFKTYDVPVDYILTPTRIIKVNHKLPKPEGIIWAEFTERQLKYRKFFKELKLVHESEGKDTTLKVETPEDRYAKIPHQRWPYSYKRRRPRARIVHEETTASNRKPVVKPKKVIPPRSTPVKNASSTSVSIEPSEDIENIPPPKRTKKKKKKQQIDYSLKVSNIEKTVRLRDLKMALKERGIKPNKIAWKGSRGYCYLNYSKKKPKKESEGEGDGADDADEGSDAINSVIEMIQELKIHSEKCFIVKVMEPITRIETVDVTAV